jgi:hypothetical protein
VSPPKPVPKATWGHWRKRPVYVVGRAVIPANVSEIDRERIDARMYSTERDTKESTNDQHTSE